MIGYMLLHGGYMLLHDWVYVAAWYERVFVTRL